MFEHLNVRRNFFSKRIIEKWNSLSDHEVTAPSTSSFKERFNHHQSDFRNRSKKNSTTLSSHIWDLKEISTQYDLSWSILESAPKYNHTTDKCRLCNREKWYIMFRPEGATVNDRSEFYSTCRHRTQDLLSRVKS